MRIFCPATVRPSLVPPVCPTHAVGRVAPLLARTTLRSYGAGGVSRPKQARAQESRGSASSLRTRVELQARHTPATPSEQPDDSVRRHKPDQIAATLCLPVTGGRAADRSPQCATSPAGIGLVAPYCGDKSPVAPEI